MSHLRFVWHHTRPSVFFFFFVLPHGLNNAIRTLLGEARMVYINIYTSARSPHGVAACTLPLLVFRRCNAVDSCTGLPFLEAVSGDLIWFITIVIYV